MTSAGRLTKTLVGLNALNKMSTFFPEILGFKLLNVHHILILINLTTTVSLDVH